MWLRFNYASSIPGDDEIRRACDVLRPVVQAHGAALSSSMTGPISPPNWAAMGGHVRQQDMSYAEARALLAQTALSASPAMTAGIWRWKRAKPAPIMSPSGHFSPPRPRKNPKTRAEIELLRAWCEDMLVPVVAIGGITVENAPALVEAGADFLAVSERGLGTQRRAGSGGQGVQPAFFAMNARLLGLFVFLGILLRCVYRLLST